MNNLDRENKAFFDLWASFYDVTLIKPYLLFIQKKIAKYIDLKNNPKVLDVGCGTGDALVFLSKTGHPSLFGLDISEKMLEKANRKMRGKAILKTGSVEKIPFSSNSFDYVLSTEAFHHFPNPDKAVKEMKRVLKKNGKLIIADINFYFKFIHWLFKKIEPGHVKIYNESEFKSLFNKNNIKILNQRRIGLFVIATIGKKTK